MKSYIKRGFSAYPEEDETNGRGQDLWARPAKDSVEVLMTYPPKLRVNGKIVPWPEGQSPEDVYRENWHMEKKQTETGFSPLRGRQTEDLEDIKDFSLPSEERETSGRLHPLRKQYLENRLEQLDYAERQQRRQDDFTTRMYGRGNYGEEREKILEELRSGKQSVGLSPSSYENNREKLWGDIHLQQERDKANGKPFQTATLEEWQAKDNEYQKTQPSHCNTAVGSLLKEKGIDLPANESMNDIINFMNHSSEWRKIPHKQDGRLDHQTANRLAQEGETVVFGYHNRSGHGHGGVLTGNPKMSESKNFMDAQGNKIPVPEVKGSVGNEEITVKHLGYHLTSDKEADTDYYVYEGSHKKSKRSE